MVPDRIDDWEGFVGAQVKLLRLQKNITQQELASRAGISPVTLSNLEGGRGSTLKTFLAVIEVLDKTSWIKNLAPPVPISPLQMITHGKQRKRARSKGTRF